MPPCTGFTSIPTSWRWEPALPTRGFLRDQTSRRLSFDWSRADRQGKEGSERNAFHIICHNLDPVWVERIPAEKARIGCGSLRSEACLDLLCLRLSRPSSPSLSPRRSGGRNGPPQEARSCTAHRRLPRASPAVPTARPLSAATRTGRHLKSRRRSSARCARPARGRSALRSILHTAPYSRQSNRYNAPRYAPARGASPSTGRLSAFSTRSDVGVRLFPRARTSRQDADQPYSSTPELCRAST